MKELYLYSGIYDFTAENLVRQIEAAGDVDISIRMLTPGGSVFAGWSIIGKLQERTAKTTMKVDGAVMSMGSVMLAFADTVEALDVSTIMLHRADMYVSSDEDQAFLDNVNKVLRSKLEAKIDLTKLPASKAITMDQLFDPQNRVDLFLTAKEARAIGLVDKINKVNPKEIEAINNSLYNIAASGGSSEGTENSQGTKESQKTTIMTIAELKEKHPAVYAEVKNLGIAEERDRVEACLVFVEIDAKGVTEAIASGKPLTQKQMADFTMKSLSATKLKEIGADGAGKTITEEAEAGKTEKEKKQNDFLAEAKTTLGLKS